MNARARGDFVPVNSLETKLRTLLRDGNTPSWSFYTPLAAAELWIITRHYPELDGSDLVASEGEKPEVCVFHGAKGAFVGLYTARSRAEEVFAKWKIPPAEYTQIASTGFALLGWLSPFDANLVINAGLPECQLQLDPDLVEILLSRPEPPPADEAGSGEVAFDAPDELRESLAPLHEFLSAQPEVRAAWLFMAPPEAALPPGHGAYKIGLLMADPEDGRFLDKAAIMAKALTPVEMEWSTMLLMADAASLEEMATRHRPFYVAPAFAKARPSR